MVTAATEAPPLRLVINGNIHEVSVEPRVTLLDCLRDYLRLTGTKKGCDHGVCGACTVIIDGKRRVSCLTLAVMQEGAAIETIEGVAQSSGLHPLQEAFLRHDAFQCGYCTPGQIMAAIGLLREGVEPDPDKIRERLENQCRCGCYTNIVAAIADVAEQLARAK